MAKPSGWNEWKIKIAVLSLTTKEMGSVGISRLKTFFIKSCPGTECKMMLRFKCNIIMGKGTRTLRFAIEIDKRSFVKNTRFHSDCMPFRAERNDEKCTISNDSVQNHEQKSKYFTLGIIENDDIHEI